MKSLLLSFLFALGCALHLNAQLPAVKLKNIDGKTIETHRPGYEGRPLIITFFATWCKPCLRELTAIAEVYDQWKAETDVEVIAVSIDEGANSFKVKPFVSAQGWEFPIWLDSNKDLMRALQVNMVPTALVLDEQRKVVYRHTGYVEGSEEELIEHVKKLHK